MLPQWLRNDFGVNMGGENLTNLRFADDVILIAHTRGQLTNMMQDFFRASAAVGLSVHPDKTKVLTNVGRGRGKDNIDLEAGRFSVIPREESVQYLGRCLSMASLHDTELDSRIEKGWKKFFANKNDLCLSLIHI